MSSKLFVKTSKSWIVVLFKLFNPIVTGLFDSTILVGGGKKAPPYLTLLW